MTHTIDATNKSLGRIASKVAQVLCGKHQPDYNPGHQGSDIVRVENVDKIRITGNKLNQKIYRHYTGYPGGLKQETMKEVIDKKGYPELLRRAVWGMLPKNKLRSERIKRLRFG